MGRRSTTGGVTPAGDRIAIRFTWQGKDLRPTLSWKPTAANLRAALKLRQAIVDEIRDGTFVLARHFPDYRFAAQLEADEAERTLADWFDVWAQVSARSMEHSTLAIYQRHMRAYWLSAWGSLLPRRITHEMVLTRLSHLAAERLDESTGKVVKGLGRKTQNNILIPLRGVFALACKSTGAPDPTAGVENLKVQKPQPDPFTIDEVELVLAKARQLEGDDMADWFEFAFFAGLRISEQIALAWADVDVRTSTAQVRGARVMGKAKDRTKTHVERTVELNDRAAAVLERQRARTQLQPHGKVFATAGNPGKPWHDDQVQWKAWQRVLQRCGVRYRAPKEARDTSVSLALSAGAGPRWVAEQHGHSLQVMLASYAKWIPGSDRGRNIAAVNSALQGHSK